MSENPPHRISQLRPCSCCAVLQANWLGDSREAWQERISAAAGASSVGSLLRKHGLPQRLSEALCAELGLEARRCALLSSAVFPLRLGFCVKWLGDREQASPASNRYLVRQAGPLKQQALLQ